MKLCPSDDQLQRLLAEALPNEESQQVGTHLEGCASCQEVLEGLVRQSAPAAMIQSPSAGYAPSEPGRQFLLRLRERASSVRPGDTQPEQSSQHAEAAPDGRKHPLPSLPGYDILEELGRGGMGVVYKARQLSLNRPVALKMLHAGCRVRPEMRERFQAEAEAIARLQHPNIVQVHEIGEAEGEPYFSLELVEQGSLARCLRGTPQPIRDAATLVETLARAIHYAHGRGLVHRDLKPANVLMSFSRELSATALAGGPRLTEAVPKITDFGLARWLDREHSLTDSDALVGTPSYMSPEQAGGRHHEAGPAADVYSLGAILYELLTGRPPFKGETAVETALQVLHTEPVAPGRLRPNLPRDLETICLKCLHKESHKRYATALDLAEDLERFLAGRSILARPVGPLGRWWRWGRANPALAALSLALCLAVLGGGTAVTWKWLEAEEHRQQAVKETGEKEIALEQKKTESGLRAIALAEAEDNLYSYALSLALREWQANNLVAADKLLDSCPARLRHWEWHHLKRLCHPDVAPSRPAQWSTPVAFSGDGRFGASFEKRGLTIWDAATAQTIRTLVSPFRCSSLCFSPKGDLLAGGNWGVAPIARGIRVWNTATGQELPHLRESLNCFALAFTPDGRRLASVLGGGIVQVKDVNTGQVLQTLTPFGQVRHFTTTFTFSPDARHLAVVWRGSTIHLAGLTGAPPLLLPTGHVGQIVALALAQDLRLVASASFDETVRVWRRQGNQLLLTAMFQVPGVKALKFTPDGARLVTLGGTRTLKVWDAASGRALFDIRARLAGVTGISVCPDGQRLAAVGTDQTVRLLRLHPPQVAMMLPPRPYSSAFALSPSGSLFAAAPDWKILLVRDILTGKECCRLPQAAGPVIYSTFSPDGQLLAGITDDHKVLIWDVRTARLRFTLEDRQTPPAGPLKPKGLPTSPVARAPTGPAKAIALQVGLSPAWARIASSQLLSRHWLGFSPDSQTLAVRYRDGTIKLWDSSGRETARFRSQTHTMSDLLVFGPDGRSLAGLAENQTFKVWEARSGKEWWSVSPPRQASFTSVSLSPPGNLLALGCTNGSIRLHQYVTGQEVGALVGHAGDVWALAFSPDGRRLASAGSDRRVKIWDVPTRRELLSFSGEGTRLQFTADGGRLITVGTGSQPIKVWDGRPLTVARALPERSKGRAP